MTSDAHLAVRVSPRASRNEIVGWMTAGSQRELAVKVCAPPEGGKANKAVCTLIASSIGLARSRVTIVSGQSSHHKKLGIEVDTQRFADWCAGFPEI